MTDRALHIAYGSIITFLVAATISAIVFDVRLYRAYTNLAYDRYYYLMRRDVTIAAVDTDERVLLVSPSSAPVASLRLLQIRVNENTVLQRQEVILDGGVVVGLGPLAAISLENIAPGQTAHALIGANLRGEYEARRIIVGPVLPR